MLIKRNVVHAMWSLGGTSKTAGDGLDERDGRDSRDNRIGRDGQDERGRRTGQTRQTVDGTDKTNGTRDERNQGIVDDSLFPSRLSRSSRLSRPSRRLPDHDAWCAHIEFFRTPFFGILSA